MPSLLGDRSLDNCLCKLFDRSDPLPLSFQQFSQLMEFLLHGIWTSRLYEAGTGSGSVGDPWHTMRIPFAIGPHRHLIESFFTILTPYMTSNTLIPPPDHAVPSIFNTGELDPSVPSPTLSMPLDTWYGIESGPLPTSFTFSDFLEPLRIHGLFTFRFNKV